MKLLFAMSDGRSAQSIELMLRSDGFNVYVSDLAEEAVDLAKMYDYQAIVLADVLLDMPGLDVVRLLRAAKVATPVLMLAHGDGSAAEVHALDAGADDYLRMPFHRDVLVSRLRSMIRRSQGHATTVIEVGSIAVDIGSKQVRAAGTAIHLTGKEYQIVEALALRKGLVLTKDMLLNQLYGGMDEPELKIIDVFVCKLRNKLRAFGAAKHIETVWGRGYRLVETPEERSEGRPTKPSPVQDGVLKALEGGARGFEGIRRAVPWVAEGTVRNALQTLIARGDVERRGAARATAYRLRVAEAAQ